jgi:hypothetical protein
MTTRTLMVALLAVVIAVSAIELSSWVLGRAVSAVVPSASVTEVDASLPHASEIETPVPAAAPAITW